MQILKCHEAEELGRSLAERAPNCRTFGGTMAEQPDFKIRDWANCELEASVRVRRGAEMGAHTAFRRGFNKGLGRDLFDVS